MLTSSQPNSNKPYNEVYNLKKETISKNLQLKLPVFQPSVSLLKEENQTQLATQHNSYKSSKGISSINGNDKAYLVPLAQGVVQKLQEERVNPTKRSESTSCNCHGTLLKLRHRC